jgi:hypothetical protein
LEESEVVVPEEPDPALDRMQVAFGLEPLVERDSLVAAPRQVS